MRNKFRYNPEIPLCVVLSIVLIYAVFSALWLTWEVKSNSKFEVMTRSGNVTPNEMIFAKVNVMPTKPVEPVFVELIATEIVEPTEPAEDLSYIRYDIPLDSDTQKLLKTACDEFDIPYELALAVVWRESTYENIINDEGIAFGYMQVLPYWHRTRMERLGVVDLMDPLSNFRVGCSILRDNLDYSGSVEYALTMYNTGYMGSSYYASSIINKMNEFIGGDS